MMEIVVKIPKDVYTRLFDPGIQDNEIAVDDVCEMARALRLGKPLPEHHGRIIDADELEECIELMNTINGETKYAVRWDDIRNMATIIEADKGE